MQLHMPQCTGQPPTTEDLASCLLVTPSPGALSTRLCAPGSPPAPGNRHHGGVFTNFISRLFMFVLFSAGNVLVTCPCWETPRCATKTTHRPSAHLPDPHRFDGHRTDSAVLPTRHWDRPRTGCSQGPGLVQTQMLQPEELR